MEVGGEEGQRRGRGRRGAEEEDLPLLLHWGDPNPNDPNPRGAANLPLLLDRCERRPWLDQVLPDVGGGS